MKIGSKGFYGVLAMADLGRAARSERPVQVREIAQRQKIPEEYLGHIMVLLKRGNLVRGTRGPGGGYELTRSPESINLAEILIALEGPFTAPEFKIQRNHSRGTVSQKLIEAWGKAVLASEKVLEEVTLTELCRSEDKLPMYYI
jgi:Rrf2 family protein